MRGSHDMLHYTIVVVGIIPAHAGLTRAGKSCGPGRWDHPRACGAHLLLFLLHLSTLGSSPRMRGSRKTFAKYARFLGIIPAHAGLTVDKFVTFSSFGDHPRACGAH